MDKKVYILRAIFENESKKHPSRLTQRELRESAGVSLGSTNKLLLECKDEGLLIPVKELGYQLTDEGLRYLEPYKVEKAVILAAGLGSRFVPLSFETPKGLLEVFGEPMMERQIKQLHEAGITDISIVVGYLKEKFDYLTDRYGVKLIYNPEYAVKNTIASVYAAAAEFEGHNTYILNSDNWLRDNIYHLYEGRAWYCAQHADGPTSEWVLKTDVKGRITDTYPGGKDCDYMYGPAYFSREFSDKFMPVLKLYHELPGTEGYFWEHVLMEMLNGNAKKRATAYFGKLTSAEHWKDIEMYISLMPPDTVYEFEDLEQLRSFDPRYENDSGSQAMQVVSHVFNVSESEIVKIKRLKAGMTNNSWLFSVHGEDYICRIPGEGTGKLVRRDEEKAVYEAIEPLSISEEIVYMDADTGYKISRFYKNSRNADPKDPVDLRYCMKKLRLLHTSGVRVEHTFDIGERIDWYEELCLESVGIDKKSVFAEGSSEEDIRESLSHAVPFSDYMEIRAMKMRLCEYLDSLRREKCLSHIDSVYDNFLFLKGADISETERDLALIRLIDWEYSAMCDPFIDLGMAAIYAYMNEEEARRLVAYYLEREPTPLEYNVVYSYMALGGLLWALWGIYKENLGVQFTDYTLKMYRYFKTYYKKVDMTLR